jgi:hypothetical protein
MDLDSAPVSPQRSRRDFIRRTAITGAVVWSAPAILSISNAGAASPPPTPCIPCTTCAASSYGVLVSGTVASLPVTLGPTPTAPPDTTVLSVALPGVISTDVITVTAGESAACVCGATATIDGATVLAGVVSTGVIFSEATQPCDCSAGTLTSTVAALTILGISQNVTGAPNQILIGASLTAPFTTTTVTVTANAQSCVGGLKSVDALVVNVSVVLDPPLLPPQTLTDVTIHLAHSQVQTNCPC